MKHQHWKCTKCLDDPKDLCLITIPITTTTSLPPSRCPWLLDEKPEWVQV